MPANHSSPRIHYLAGKHPNRIGWLVGPSARTKTKLRPWIPYALDNDAFSAWTKGTEWNVEEWRALLQWARFSGQSPRWCIVPDVVADKTETLEKWTRYAPEAANYGWPLAFAVQDGMTPDDVPEDADVIFVGGTTEWKWRSLPTWCKNFRRVHVGRVNEIRRLYTCEEYGVESCDGTGWIRDPGDPRKLDALADWLSGELTDTQMTISNLNNDKANEITPQHAAP